VLLVILCWHIVWRIAEAQIGNRTDGTAGLIVVCPRMVMMMMMMVAGQQEGSDHDHDH